MTFELNKLRNIIIQKPVQDSRNIQSFTHSLATINEHNCIGCNRCAKICPVNAIVGSARTVHTVMAKICTGCSLCVTSCPTECISIQSTKVFLNIEK